MTITIAPTTQPPHWAPFPSPSSPSPTSTSNTIVHHGPQPHHHHHHHASPSPSLSSTTTTNSRQSQSLPTPPPPPQSKLPVDFSPPLIAMVVIVAAAFLIVTYSRLISRHLLPPLLAFTNRFRRRRHRHRRRPPSSVGDMDSPPYDPSAFHALSPYGLDDSAIKTIPISLFTKTNNHNNNNKTTSSKDSSASACCCCAVCLVEFEDNDYVRTLPVCSHAFHVDCIDVWLRSHANCPLCRAGIFAAESPFIPVMASRIRPSFVDVDDSLMLMTNFMPLFNNSENSIADSARSPVRSFSTVTEIIPCAEESPRMSNLINSEERRFSNGGNNSSACRDDMLLKRSYSFGFERSLAAERMLVMEPSTASPWRHRRSNGGVGFWSKRLSPFATSLTKSRVFSFRQYRGGGGGGGGGGGMNVKYSPFFIRRRGGLGFFPLSERFNNISGGGGGGSSRRTKSLTSPMFMRSSASGTTAFSSSRLRCGDPEALLSPERFNRR